MDSTVQIEITPGLGAFVLLRECRDNYLACNLTRCETLPHFSPFLVDLLLFCTTTTTTTFTATATFVSIPQFKTTLIANTVQSLPMASISALSLLFKPGPTFWSGCQRVTTRTALLGFSNPPRSRNQRYCYSQTLGRPRHLHSNAQLLIATQITPSVPQILFHGTRRLHSISEEPTDSASSSQSSSTKESSSDHFLGFLFFLLVWLGPADRKSVV